MKIVKNLILNYKFCTEIMKIKDDFDVALCSCGGYGNPICAFIYNIGKSQYMLVVYYKCILVYMVKDG